MTNNIISTESLYSGYDKNQVLQNINFTAKNEITAILGANGSGKSTLLKSIIGLCDIKSGNILFNKKNITNLRPHQISKLGISYMPQINNVFGDLTILENLKINDATDTAFEIFPILQQYSDKKAKHLSGGERQMLAMAITLTGSPQVILFDEPTAALSPQNARLVHDKIIEIQQRLNLCIILVEQNAKMALDMCDTVYLFSSGKIKYHGDPQKLRLDLDAYLGVRK
jgi:branched-chain amino acid transport system ATP-binding protein